MQILKEFQTTQQCSYLDNREQISDYKLINNCSLEESQAFIERGYRRFGKVYFRPVCSGCDECKSLKIDATNFKFSKSARRIIKKCSHLEIIIQKPTMTHEHLELFDNYHRYMHHKKGWQYQPTSPEHYYGSFVDGAYEYGFEVLYFHNTQLIGVDLIDILEDGISSIYFYYHPEFSHLSLGKYSLYEQIRLAQQLNKRWIYLGYYVKECPSLSYKAEYKPHYILQGRPSLTQEAIWS